jgi:hypothetical protein
MKKIILLSVSLTLLSQTLVSQDFNKLIKEFSKTEGVEKIKLDGVVFWLAKAFMPQDAKNEVTKMLKSVEVFMSENVETQQIKDFTSKLKNIKDNNGFETLTTVKDGRDNIIVVLERKKKTITSMLVFLTDETDIMIVRLKGKIKEANIDKLINQYTKD